MRHNHLRRLKQQIKELQEENKYLQVGIDTREKAYDYVCEQHDRQMAMSQELTFLLLYMESIVSMTKDDYSTNAKTIRRAIGKFKSELIDGFASNHLIMLPNINKLDNNIKNN